MSPDHNSTIESALDARRLSVASAIQGHDLVLVLDRGVGATSLATRLRESGYCAAVLPATAPASHIRALEPAGLIISAAGSADSPMPDAGLLDGTVPVLAVGDSFLRLTGVVPAAATGGQPGRVRVELMTGRADDPLLAGVFASGCVLVDAAAGARIDTASWRSLWRRSDGSCGVAVHRELPIVGMQPHPEAAATTFGARILENFAHQLCAARPTWTPARWAHDAMGGITEGIRGLPAAVVAEPSARSLCTVALTLRAVPAGRVHIQRLATSSEPDLAVAQFADAVETQGAVHTRTIDPNDPGALTEALAGLAGDGLVVITSGDVEVGDLPPGVVRSITPLAGLTPAELQQLAVHVGIDISGLSASRRQRVRGRRSIVTATAHASSLAATPAAEPVPLTQ